MKPRGGPADGRVPGPAAAIKQEEAAQEDSEADRGAGVRLSNGLPSDEAIDDVSSSESDEGDRMARFKAQPPNLSSASVQPKSRAVGSVVSAARSAGSSGSIIKPDPEGSTSAPHGGNHLPARSAKGAGSGRGSDGPVTREFRRLLMDSPGLYRELHGLGPQRLQVLKELSRCVRPTSTEPRPPPQGRGDVSSVFKPPLNPQENRCMRGCSIVFCITLWCFIDSFRPSASGPPGGTPSRSGTAWVASRA